MGRLALPHNILVITMALTLAGCGGGGLSVAATQVAAGTPLGLASEVAELATRQAQGTPVVQEFGTRRAQNTPLPVTVEVGERVEEYDAAEAIRSYASRVLGVAVEVTAARGRTGTLTVALPDEAQESVDAAVTLAGASYLGLLEGGAASVSLGDGAISGDLTADIDTASLGVIALVQPGALPGSESEALEHIRQTFPGLSGLDFQPRATQGPGFSFTAAATHQELDIASAEYVAVNQSVLAAVTPAMRENRVWTWAVVANGELSKALTFD